jgi:ribosomal protein S18 acetylase RimI-like enzyme
MAAWVVDDTGYIGECIAPGSLDDEVLLASMDRWIDARLRGHVRSARGDNPVGIARLEAAGYRRVPDDMVAFSLDLDRLGPTEPDPRVSTVARSDDLGARLSVTHAAFRVDRAFDDYIAGYRRFMDSPAYPDGWDLVAWTPAGDAAACCIAWPDPVSRVGNFEPVATHPSFHRQGFATVVLRDGLHRLREAGMRRAVVRTPADNAAALALYRSVGFEPDHEQLSFRRPTADGPID